MERIELGQVGSVIHNQGLEIIEDDYNYGYGYDYSDNTYEPKWVKKLFILPER